MYNLNSQQMATGFVDMWDGVLIRRPDLTVTLDTLSVQVWTGSESDCTAATTSLGSSTRARRGDSRSNLSQWLNSANPPASGEKRMFAISEQLTVASAAVPEPSTFAILGMGTIGMIAFRRRKQKQAAGV